MEWFARLAIVVMLGNHYKFKGEKSSLNLIKMCMYNLNKTNLTMKNIANRITTIVCISILITTVITALVGVIIPIDYLEVYFKLLGIVTVVMAIILWEELQDTFKVRIIMDKTHAFVLKLLSVAVLMAVVIMAVMWDKLPEHYIIIHWCIASAIFVGLMLIYHDKLE
jgi:hypothetical protein